MSHSHLSLHGIRGLALTARAGGPNGRTQWLSITGCDNAGNAFDVALFCDDARALLLSAIKPHADLIALDHIASTVAASGAEVDTC